MDGRLRLLGSTDGRDGSITIHQNVDLWGGRLAAGKAAELPVAAGRTQWVQVARGAVDLDGETLEQGDGATVTGARALHLRGGRQAEVLVFDMA